MYNNTDNYSRTEQEQMNQIKNYDFEPETTLTYNGLELEYCETSRTDVDFYYAPKTDTMYISYDVGQVEPVRLQALHPSTDELVIDHNTIVSDLQSPLETNMSHNRIYTDSEHELKLKIEYLNE